MGGFKNKTESFPIAAQFNAIRSNCIKAKIDKTQLNSKCRLGKERNERECCRLA